MPLVPSSHSCEGEREREKEREREREREKETEQDLRNPERTSTYRVDVVDAFSSFVTFPSDPVTVEIGTNTVQHFGRELVILPLLGVEH